LRNLGIVDDLYTAPFAASALLAEWILARRVDDRRYDVRAALPTADLGPFDAKTGLIRASFIDRHYSILPFWTSAGR
jgi:hypothetical protein